MNEFEKSAFLNALDADRWTFSDDGNVVRECSPDGLKCRILAIKNLAMGINSLIISERNRAKQNHYSLEWKTYEHDYQNQVLCNYLLQAGFEAQDEEVILVKSLSDFLGTQFDLRILPKEAEIIEVRSEKLELGLEWVAEISREIGRTEVEQEKSRLRSILAETPSEMSIYVILMHSQPIACGRIHYPTHSIFAELCGGRTKTTFRKRGFFTALVNHRLIEAAGRGRKAVLVDALPTSEPILKTLGFEVLTRTRPYIYKPCYL